MKNYRRRLAEDAKMVREVKNLTNIKLTESDTDGIWLHFEAGNLKADVSLQVLSAMQSGGIVAAAIQNWAREQLDKQDSFHCRFQLHQKYSLPHVPANGFLKEGHGEQTAQPGTRPSPSVEGGY